MLSFAPVTDRPFRLLAIGAHADDIEIGAGGTVLTLLGAAPGTVQVTWVVLSATAARQAEAEASAQAFCADAAGLDVTVRGLTDGHFPAEWEVLKSTLQALSADVDPDLILAPRRGDAHQDHDLVGAVIPTCFRDHVIWGYEIPKYDGDTIQPHTYVPLAEATLDRKIALLDGHFGSQRTRDWWDDEVFRALPRLRGVECKARYAEAFVSQKTVISFARSPEMRS